ncbi:MAG: glycosyltransferase family 2 protein, partial [Gemmatimonadaceae bacterium]
MSAPPRVSVVVPTYNRAPLLRGALATVAAQTFPAWECLVCDDGSSDGTLDLVREIARGDPRFRLVPGPRFGLPAGPRNRGIRAAHAPWVAFLDDDDVWHPRKLEHQVWALEREPADAVSARYRAFRGDTPPPFEADDGAPRTLGRIGLAGVLLHHPPFPATPSNIIARSALLELGGFDESTAYRAVEDLDLWSRLLSRPGFRWLAVEGMPLLAYRELGSDSISAWDHTLEPDVIRQRWAILEIMGRIIRGRPALGTAEWRALIAAMRDRADDCAARCRAVGWR